MQELLLQLSKDSYRTKLGDYKGRKTPINLRSRVCYRSSSSWKQGSSSVAVRTWVWLEVPREGTVTAGISLVNRSV